MTIREVLEQRKDSIEVIIGENCFYIVDYELLEEYDLTLNDLIADILNTKVIGRQDEFYIVEVTNPWILNSFERFCEEE